VFSTFSNFTPRQLSHHVIFRVYTLKNFSVSTILKNSSIINNSLFRQTQPCVLPSILAECTTAEDGIPPTPVQRSPEHSASIDGRTLWYELSEMVVMALGETC
jgi:hypothetical protein